jgi:hypothetical protein
MLFGQYVITDQQSWLWWSPSSWPNSRAMRYSTYLSLPEDRPPDWTTTSPYPKCPLASIGTTRAYAEPASQGRAQPSMVWRSMLVTSLSVQWVGAAQLFHGLAPVPGVYG